MTDDRKLIDRLRASLDEGARAVRSTPPPFTIVGSTERPAPTAEEGGPWRWLAVAATVVAIAATGIVALAVTAGDEPDAGPASTSIPTTIAAPFVESAGPGTIPSDPPEIGDVHFSTDEVRTGGMVFEDDAGPRFCNGARTDQWPPRCGGVLVTNWTWPEGGFEADTTTGSNARWGSYILTGRYNAAGTEFTITGGVENPKTSNSAPAHDVVSYDRSTPCPEPAGGWNSPFLWDGSTPTSGLPNTRQIDGVERLPGFGGTWYDDKLGVRNVRIVGEEAERESARASIARVYDGPVCIVPTRYTEKQLRQVQDQITELDGPWSWVRSSWGVRIDARTAAAHITLRAPVPDLENALLAHYGDAITFEHLFEYVNGAPNVAAAQPTIPVMPAGLSVEPDETWDTTPEGPLVGGAVTPVAGCVVLRGTSDLLPVWPSGTRWDSALGAIVLPDGTQLMPGSQISAIGHTSHPRTPEEASPSTNIPERAADRLVAEVDGLDECIASTGVRDVMFGLEDVTVVEQPDAVDRTAAPFELTAIARVVDKAEGGPTWCWQRVVFELDLDQGEEGGNSTDDGCLGSTLPGWDWSRVDSRVTDDRRWGVYVIVGRFDATGEVFTLTEPARPVTSADYDALALEPTDDFSTPCEPPPGGWDLPPQDTVMVSGTPVTSVPLQLAQLDQARLNAVEGFGGVWLDWDAGVYNIKIVGDEAAREAARDEIETFYDGPICIVEGSHTWAELQRTQTEIQQRPRAMHISTGLSIDGVSVHLIARAPDFEAELRQRYGDAVVFETEFPDVTSSATAGDDRAAVPTAPPASTSG